MKRALTLLIIVLALGLPWWFLKSPDKEETPSQVIEPEPLITPAPPRQPVLADNMLADYASDDSSGKSDLQMMARFLDSVFLLVKQRDTADYATNEDLALFLKGVNPHQTAFLNPDSPALNQKSQLIDRWGSPLIVHPVSRKLLQIRSAGPDQKPYTEDDFLWPDG